MSTQELLGSDKGASDLPTARFQNAAFAALQRGMERSAVDTVYHYTDAVGFWE